jgi:hypothetical protein
MPLRTDPPAARSPPNDRCTNRAVTRARWRTRSLKNVWKGVRREIGIAQKGKSALVIEGLRDVVIPFGARRIDVRDRALLLVGFAAALRRQ